MKGYSLELFYSQSQVVDRVREMADEIFPDFSGTDMTVVILTLGGMRFGMDLYDHLSDFVEPEKSILLDAMGVTSYKGGTKSNGAPEIFQPLKEPEVTIANRHVLVVDDIRHSSNTLDKVVVPHIEKYGPSSLSVATLLAADGLADLPISGKTYKGFTIDKDDYVVGTLLDKGGLHRGMKGIWKVIFDASTKK